MTAPISRGSVIGTVAKGERKTVGDKQLVEFYIEGFGLRINAWGDLSNEVPPVGSFVMVEGAIKTRAYQATVNDEKVDRQTTEITASSITALDGATPIEDKPAPKPEPIKPPSQGF